MDMDRMGHLGPARCGLQSRLDAARSPSSRDHEASLSARNLLQWLGSVTSPSTWHPIRRGLPAAIGGACLLLAGCDFLGLMSEEDRAREGVVTLSATGDLAPLMDAIPVASTDDAQDEVAAALSSAWSLEDPACLTVETLGNAIIVEFADCVLADSGYPVDGTMYVRDILGDGQSASYSIVIEQLRLGFAASIDANWTLTRQPGATSWSGNLDVETSEARSLGREVEASWTESGGCRVIDLGAELGFFGVTNLAVSGLEVCAERCPTAGEAEISWDAGSSAAWSYDGSASVEVVIARGDRFDVDLNCTPN